MICSRLVNYLKSIGVDYGTLSHSPAFTALEVAEAAQVQGRDLIKSVVVNVDGRPAVVVMPAHYQLQLEPLRERLKADYVSLMPESEFAAHFDGCAVGAVPAFGTLFGMPTYTAVELAPNEVVALNGGSHTDLLLMSWGEYTNIEHPEYIEGVAMSPSITPPKMSYRRGRIRL